MQKYIWTASANRKFKILRALLLLAARMLALPYMSAQELTGTLQIKSQLSPRVDLWAVPPSFATLTVQSPYDGLEVVPLVSVRSGNAVVSTFADRAPTLVLRAGNNQFGLNDLVRKDTLGLVNQAALRSGDVSGYVLTAGNYRLCIDLKSLDSNTILLPVCTPFAVPDLQVNYDNDVRDTDGHNQSYKRQTTQNSACESDVKTVEVSFHIFQKADGSNNFKNNATDRAALADMIDQVNNFQTNNSKSSDPIPGVVDVTDTRIRYELGNRIYFYQDDNLNASTDIGQLQAAVAAVDPNRLNQLNIYETTGNLGASGEASRPSFDGTHVDQYVLQVGAYADWTSTYHTLWGAILNLAHEFGHNLNLLHTYPRWPTETCNSADPDFLDDVFSTSPNEVCLLDGAWDVDPWQYQNWNSSGSFTNPPDTYTNDMMDGTKWAAYSHPSRYKKCTRLSAKAQPLST